MRACWISIWAFCLVVFLAHPASADKRVALVIGNSAYQNVARLLNPANDSAAMADTLKKAGFDVVELKRDLKANEMRRALRDFSDAVRDADVAIVFYAGHGIEIDGLNYLIPTDATLERDIDAFDEAIPLDRLLTVIEPAKKLRLVVLDACRDNPFTKTIKRTIASRSIGRGLAKVEPGSPNTLIAYAAKAGSTASDGDSKNSPFTAALVKHLPRPGLDLRKAFGFARDEVLKATNNRQEPFIYGSLGGEDFALVEAPVVKPDLAQPDLAQAARRDYELAERVGTREAWDYFISTYPDSFYAKLAQAQRNKLAAEQSRLAAVEKARLAEEERARLAADGARASAQAKAAADARIAEAARAAAERKKAVEEAKIEAERAQTRAAEEARIAKATVAGVVARKDESQSTDDKPVGPVAALTSPGDASAVDQDNIPRSLQRELWRVGCGSGPIGRDWSATAQKALQLFNKSAGTQFDVKLASVDVLYLVRSKPGRVCPLICEYGYRVDGDTCARIVCKEGYGLSNENSCEPRMPRRKETPTATVTPERRASPAPERGGAPSGVGRANQAKVTGAYRSCMGATSGCYERAIKTRSPEQARAWCSRAPTC